MSITVASLCASLFTSILVILSGIFIYYKWAFTYWKNKGVFAIKATFPVGSAEFGFKKHIGIFIKEFYDEIKSHGHKHGGFYLLSAPVYLPVDPKLIKQIIQQDFQYFTDHGAYYNEKDDPLSANLFFLKGDQWKNMRTKLSPAFTPGKFKQMFDLMVKYGFQLQEAIIANYQRRQPVDIRDLAIRYTVDSISSCGFGIESNCFKNADSKFMRYADRLFNQPSAFTRIKFGFAHTFQDISRWLGIRVIGQEPTDFFVKVIEESVQFRESNNILRNDFLQLLIELRNQEENSNEENIKKFTIIDITTQVFIFLVGGFETSSTTLTFCLYELATNLDIQEKVRREINKILDKNANEFTYNAVTEMKYMDQVLNETLRKYPPGSVIMRQCVQDYQVPDTDVVIEKGTTTIIPVLGLHRDPEYYSNPDRFDPERFSPKGKQLITPFTYLPFGEGPRSCIGYRFALLQLKIALVILLKRYKFTLNGKTEIPVQMSLHSLSMAPGTQILLDIEILDE